MSFHCCSLVLFSFWSQIIDQYQLLSNHVFDFSRMVLFLFFLSVFAPSTLPRAKSSIYSSTLLFVHWLCFTCTLHLCVCPLVTSTISNRLYVSFVVISTDINGFHLEMANQINIINKVEALSFGVRFSSSLVSCCIELRCFLSAPLFLSCVSLYSRTSSNTHTYTNLTFTLSFAIILTVLIQPRPLLSLKPFHLTLAYSTLPYQSTKQSINQLHPITFIKP